MIISAEFMIKTEGQAFGPPMTYPAFEGRQFTLGNLVANGLPLGNELALPFTKHTRPMICLYPIVDYA